MHSITGVYEGVGSLQVAVNTLSVADKIFIQAEAKRSSDPDSGDRTFGMESGGRSRAEGKDQP